MMNRAFRFSAVMVEFLTAALVFSNLAPSVAAREFPGLRGGEGLHGPRGGVVVEGSRGTIAIGSRYEVLPDSATMVYVQGQNYYVDDTGVYYLPCDDDDTVYCVVPAPSND